MWSEHVDNGTAMSYYPAGHDFIHDDCVPPDLHKYTGTKSEIPKGGFGGHSSYLDYPEGDAPESSGEGG
jgi:hypothetical protein